MARLSEGNLSRSRSSHGRTHRLQARPHHAFRLPLHARHAGAAPAHQIIAVHKHQHDGQLQKKEYTASLALSNTAEQVDTVTLDLDAAANSTSLATAGSTYNATPYSDGPSSNLLERRNSLPSSPVTSYDPSNKYPSVTLVNNSPVLVLPDTVTTTPTNSARRQRPTTKTPKKSKATSITLATRKRPAPTSRKATRTSRTRTAPTRTRKPANATSPSGIVAPLPAEPPRPTGVVHLCIARPPPTPKGAPLPPLITFTSTVNFPARTSLGDAAAPIRDSADPPTRSRDTSKGKNDNDNAVVETVTDYNCQLTLPLLTRPTSTPSRSASNLSPNNGLNFDDITLPPLGPNAADPTTGGDRGTGRGIDLAFFATPGGKGTIASITVVSVAWIIFLVLFFIRRKKREDGEHAIAGAAYQDRESVSSFGDLSNDQAGGANVNPLYSPAISNNMSPEMAQTGGTGPPGSFFVERRRSQPPSVRGTDTPPRGTYTNQLDAATAARAISPLAMLQAQPNAFIHPPPLAGRQRYSHDGGASGEDNPSCGSSQGHDPFRDPSSNGHTTTGHDANGAVAFTDKHERRRSGFTSDTYRKSRSRPLSVRNPDSDETRQQENVESLQLDRTPRSATSDATYGLGNVAVPDSTGLEYYLASAVPTPQGNTPIQGTSFPTLPPMPQNTLTGNDQLPETPKASQHLRGASWTGSPLLPQQLYAVQSPSAYDGIALDSPARPTNGVPEFETHETYAFPKPRPVISTSSSSTFPRPSVHPLSMQPSQLPRPTQPASSAPSSHLSRVLEYGVSARQHRQSVSSDGASSRSSMWRAWEHNNRSFISNASPNDVQDVQLGGNSGAVGGGNATSISGYFAWR